MFARPPEIATDTLVVIGGLYGNRYALEAIDAIAAAEVVPPQRVFNGDFHWFDAEPALERLRLYGLFDAGCCVDAMKIEFDLAAWLARFDAIWPADSPAAVSYRRRIAEGPGFTIDQALGRALATTCRPTAA